MCDGWTDERTDRLTDWLTNPFGKCLFYQKWKNKWYITDASNLRKASASNVNFSQFLSPMNFGEFDQKTVEKSIINTIFKQQVIPEPQKLPHFSRAWALVACKLVACINKSVMFLLHKTWICKICVSTKNKRAKNNIKSGVSSYKKQLIRKIWNIESIFRCWIGRDGHLVYLVQVKIHSDSRPSTKYHNIIMIEMISKH